MTNFGEKMHVGLVSIQEPGAKLCAAGLSGSPDGKANS
jgi:hypothetical protein